MMKFKQGQDVLVQIQRRLSDETPVDLTGIDIAAKLRDKTHVFEMTIRRINDEQGLFHVVLPASITRTMKPGIYRWDVQYTATTGWVTKWPRTGNFMIEIVESPSNA